MGTHGAIGYRINGVDKLMYNHYDSYPEGLGQQVIYFLQNNLYINIKKSASNLKLIHDGAALVSEEEFNIIDKFGHDKIKSYYSSDRIPSWHALLNDFNLNNLTRTLDFPYIVEKNDFVYDSLMCEFAYIINFDSNKLEFYNGFNKDKNAAGRYASKQRERPYFSDQYYGIKLVYEYDLNKIPGMLEDNILAHMNYISSLDEEEKLDPVELEYDFILNNSVGTGYTWDYSIWMGTCHRLSQNHHYLFTSEPTHDMVKLLVTIETGKEFIDEIISITKMPVYKSTGE
jgi:hypothetical protein